MNLIDRQLVNELVRLIHDAPGLSEEVASVMGQAVARITDLSDGVDEDAAEIVQFERQLGLLIAAVETYMMARSEDMDRTRQALEDRIATAKAHLWTT